MPKLYINEDGNEAIYEIFEDEVSLGRGAANAVQIADTHASKMHAVVRRLRDHWKLIDLESKNGTRINGEFRNQHWLSEGDTITIGVAVLRYAAEGSHQGAPSAGAAPAAVRPRPVAARPAVAAAPAVPATPAVPAMPAMPAMPAAAAAAPPPPMPAAPAPAAAPSTRRGAAPAARRRRPSRDDYYDDEYDDEDRRRPPRRSSNSALIVVLGILGAVVLGFIVVSMVGGPSVNQQVYKKAAAMADARQYEKALDYAERNADPDGDHYRKILNGMADWKKALRAQKELARGEAAREYFNRQIYHQQDITPNFHAKDALRPSEVVRLLREFLKEYKGTVTAFEVMHSEHSGYPELREAMREHADPELTAGKVLGDVQAEIGITKGKQLYGQAVMDLEYVRDMNRLCMTGENFEELRKAVQFKIDEITSEANRAFKSDERDFEDHWNSGRKGRGRKLLVKMREKYTGIPALLPRVKAMEEKR